MTNVDNLVENSKNGHKISLARDQYGRQSVYITKGKIFKKKVKIELSENEIVELQERLTFKHKEKPLMDLSVN